MKGDAPSGPYGGMRLIEAGLRFECRGCGDCCRGPGGHVFVDDDEVAALAAALAMAVDTFCERHTRRAEGRTALVDAANGDCCFFRDGAGCAVYAARPRQCRSWPFWFGNLRSEEAWRQAARGCPGIGTGKVHEVAEILTWLDSPVSRRR